MPSPTVYPIDYSNILPPNGSTGALFIGNLEAAQSVDILQSTHPVMQNTPSELF